MLQVRRGCPAAGQPPAAAAEVPRCCCKVWCQLCRLRLSSGVSTLVSVFNIRIKGIRAVVYGWGPFLMSCHFALAIYILTSICLLASIAILLCARRWDSECCENEKWKASADVSSLTRGEKQPFYHVLVDSRDWPADSSDVPVAYVAHEKLYAPEVMPFHTCLLQGSQWSTPQMHH